MQRIAGRLSARGLSVTIWRGDSLPPGVDLDRFDAFLIAASVIRGRHQSCIRDFVRAHVRRLNAAPAVFVSVSGFAATPSPAKQAEARGYVEHFLSATGWWPTLTAMFGGALACTKYGFFLRWIIKRIANQAGGPTDTTRDHDATNWEAVDQFALRVADLLAQPVAP